MDIQIPPSDLFIDYFSQTNNMEPQTVALRSVHGKYLSAQPDGRAEWNRDIANEWEYFHIEERPGG